MPRPERKPGRAALSIPSSADGTPDASLIADDGFVATSHKGLTYPFGRFAPGEGEIHELAPGVGWIRIALPGLLGHINAWLLEEEGGVAIVDTGMNVAACRESWEALFQGPLADRLVTRLFGTHLHPDHIGLAGWLCERFGVGLWMTRTEWLTIRLLQADRRNAPPPEAIDFWCAAGWTAEEIDRAKARGWSRLASVVTPLPSSFTRLSDGQDIRIGADRWRVVVGSGHTPEHACLWNEAAGLLIAGDQVLPRITSNVSLMFSEPWGDPLGDWLRSIDRFLELPDDLLVLPAHGEPFTGLHARLGALRDGHLDRLDALAGFLAEPRTAVECFPMLFRRQMSGDDLFLATGEAMAHLRRLELAGRARRVAGGEVVRFVAA